VPWLASAWSTSSSSEKKLDLTCCEFDAILVLGGDGDAAEHRAARRLVPVMANFGRLGFLAGFQPSEVPTMFERFRAGGRCRSPRGRCSTSRHRQGQCRQRRPARS
jgi:NAD kinase